MSERKKRFVISRKGRLEHPCEDIFRLACPIREDEWIPGWRDQREIIYCKSGYAELGCVFKTINIPNLMGPATWVNNIYEPFDRIQYSAMNDKFVYQMQWNLDEVNEGCEVVMTRTWTALTLEAEEFLAIIGKTVNQKPLDLFALIDHYLTTGKMMRY
jgi:hypothetical protein